VLTIWECETTDPKQLNATLSAFLGKKARWTRGP
jgi:hypothetical protein